MFPQQAKNFSQQGERMKSMILTYIKDHLASHIHTHISVESKDKRKDKTTCHIDHMWEMKYKKREREGAIRSRALVGPMSLSSK